MISIAFVILLSLVSPTAAASNAPSPMPAPSSTDDRKVLRDAVRDEMAGKRDHILVDFDQQQYLPAFDNVVHYIGITSDRQIHIIVSYAYSQPRHSKIDTFETSNIAVVEAFVLGTMDIGAAGAEWKAYYDSLAQADAALPTSVNDRYQNRRAAAAALAQAILALP